MNFKSVVLLFFFIGFIFSCKKEYKPRSFDHISIDEIKIDSSSIRAIEALKDSTLLFVTSDGYIGIAENDKAAKLQQIKYDTIAPHFRAIASNGEYSFALSVANPALLYKFDGDEPKLVYKEEHEKVFYDAMVFSDSKYGIAMGDPTDDCLSIITTIDGGNSWNKIPCDKLPKAEEGEAAFAASNGNIAVVDDNIWIVTGGKKARVFHSSDKGNTWNVYDTPIIQGGKMTGIYCVDFYDENTGIIFGGDWENKENNFSNKALTNDGGKTWNLVADGKEPGYKSSVRYVPGTKGKELFAVGSTGVSFSNDGGQSWKKVSAQGYYTIRFVNKNVAWLAGNKKIGKLILE